MAQAIKFKVSTFPAVSKRLREIATSAPWPANPNRALAGPQITIGAPPGADIQRESIIFGDAESSEEFAAIAARSRSEEYTITVYFLVIVPGQDQSVANDRAFEFLGVFAHELRNDPTVGIGPSGTVGQVIALELGGWKLMQITRPDDQAARLDVQLKVKARI